ncbi:hypothetical protein D9M69_539720 [compost metagenome]
MYIDLARFAAHQRQHAGNVRRVVLAVAIEGRQPLPACLTGRVVQRGALPQRPLVMQDAQGVQAVMADLPQFLQGRIGAAIVDHDDFVSLIGQRHADFFKQWLEVVRFVLGGNHYGYKNVLAHGVSLAFFDCSRSEANASNLIELPIPLHEFTDAGFQRHLRAEAHPIGQRRDIGPGLDHVTGLHWQVVAPGLQVQG